MRHFALSIVLLTSLSNCRKSKSNHPCNYVLRNTDFEEGTYRITNSGKYCFDEDISFNPRPGSIDNPNKHGAWFPISDALYPGSISHDAGGFALGFFAAISIEVGDVELDLNGFELSMSKEFYLQQRFFNLIEIQNAPFNSGQGPSSFGDTISKIRNIRIKNGKLGRSSHNGLHGFDVEKIYIENLKIYGFEVAGLQLNGFKDVNIRNIDIGPSAKDVPFWSYYSHARFSLIGFDLIDEKHRKYIRFKGNRKLTLQQIHDNLRDSLDIAYRYELGKTTEYDKQHPLYTISKQLYLNPTRLPDGSALYGMIFNSKGFAVQGFGDSPNEESDEGNRLYIENVNIDALALNVNEIPALYFDRCEGRYYNDDGSTSITPITGRFGDSFDARKVMEYKEWQYIDRGFGAKNNGYSYSNIVYDGNPLSDAQVALGIFSAAFENNWGLKAQADNTPGKEAFYRWATENGNTKYDSLPACARFVCNGDAMFHLNKGIIGIRLDGIENTVIQDLYITNLYNESPLGSLACGSYNGPFDGGQPSGIQREGYMGSDIKGISIVDGGWLELYGSIVLDRFVSSNGDVIGIHVMNDAQIYIDEPERLRIDNMEGGSSISVETYHNMLSDGICPYPNNFYACNIKAEQLDDRDNEAYPYDIGSSYIDPSGNGYIYPNGAVKAECWQK